MMNDIQITFNTYQDMDDDWDPMRDEYENPNVNAYDHGPGANLDVSLQRPAYRDKNNQIVYKIMVRRCPPGLSEVGLDNLFRNFGIPNISKIQRGADRIIFALVEFKTLKEAHTAIKELNACPPYNLDVRFARSDEENERLQRKKREEQKVFEQLAAMQPQVTQDLPSIPGRAMQNSSLFRMLGRGQSRGRVIANARKNPPQMNSLAWSEGTPDFVNSGLAYNPKSSKYECSNRLMQNMVISTGSDSMRRVSMGRGYIPVEDQTAFVSSSELPLQKSLGHDIYIPLQPCTNCNSGTALKCSQCGAPYCSRECQKKDFFRHKPRCSLKESIDVAMDTSILQSSRLVPLKEVENLSQQNQWPLGSSMQINRFWGRPDQNVVKVLQRERQSRETIVRMMVYAVESGSINGQLSFDKVAEVADKLFLTLPSQLDKVSRDSNFWPSVGSLVAVRWNDSVWRGYILSSPSIGIFCEYTVALCDIGLVQKVEACNILPLPSDYQVLTELGVTCNLVQPKSNFSPALLKGESLSLKVTGGTADEIIAQLQTEVGDLAIVSLSPWVPSVPNELTPVQITPPCQVVISAYHHQHAIYVRPVGREFQEQLFTIMQKVAAVHVTSPLLGRPPYKGEMVACQFQKDGNFYRGIVQDEAKDGYSVFFVDFGNLDIVSLRDMKALPEELKNIACMSTRVSLKGVRHGPLTENAIQFLNMVIQKELSLKLECLNPSDGVVLTCPDHSSLNAQLNDLLVPDWQHDLSNGIEPHRGEIFMLENINILPLTKNGGINEFATIVVLNIMVDGRIAVCPCSEEFPEVKHVLQTLTDQINEYCEALDSNMSYNPRLRELCLAKYHKDGLWYRAVNTATSTESQSCNVAFLDYGNIEEVTFNDIRKIVPEFINSPAIMSTCRIDGFPLHPSADQVMRLRELLPLNKAYEVKVVDRIEDGFYKISILEVSDQLKSEFNL